MIPNLCTAWDLHCLGYYAAYSGNPLPTFQENLSDPIFKGQQIQEERFLEVKKTHFFGLLHPWIWDRYVVPKRRQVITTIRCITSQKSADLIYVAAEAWNHTLCRMLGTQFYF
jgi:hypothetical protein